MRYVLAWVLAVAMAGVGLAADAPKKSAFDKTTLEAYVRHLFLWGPQIQVSISEPKSSELPGMKLV
ncbi:MAG: hypothetical protein GY953_47350, partial [bacterium]|nr:hypothetical protein [bacterium]